MTTFPVTSVFKRFYKKMSVIPEVIEEPPATPSAPSAPAAPADPDDVLNASEEILQTQRKGTVHIEALLPLYVVVSYPLCHM